ncbi:putative teichoic acid biosynthesis protein B [Listeria rocourtiae FSL F6-920]|nr:putative teichoic acid biosynthesis protein B [Listeria rocourtiae FSL F6-920]
MYKTFSKIVVGSDEMGELFKRSFLVDDSRLMKLGVPRTDYYFDGVALEQNRSAGLAKYGVKDKKSASVCTDVSR